MQLTHHHSRSPTFLVSRMDLRCCVGSAVDPLVVVVAGSRHSRQPCRRDDRLVLPGLYSQCRTRRHLHHIPVDAAAAARCDLRGSSFCSATFSTAVGRFGYRRVSCRRRPRRSLQRRRCGQQYSVDDCERRGLSSVSCLWSTRAWI